MGITKNHLFLPTVLTIFITSLANAMEVDYRKPQGGKYNNPLVNNVEKLFNKIPTDPIHLAAWENDKVDWPRYTFSDENEKGIQNHFQGIARLSEYLGVGQYIVLSGGNSHEKISDLFIIKMGSQDPEELWSENTKNGKPKKGSDKIVAHIEIDKTGYWHAGGMQTCGKYLAIPLEGRGSKVVFYDISNPENPKKLNVYLKREGQGQGGAVAFTRLANGQFLLAIWQDKYGLDFYCSVSDSIDDGFEKIGSVSGEKIKNLVGRKDFPEYQMINFVQETSGNIYLIGTRSLAVLKNRPPASAKSRRRLQVNDCLLQLPVA